MAKWARVDNEEVKEVISVNPTGKYHSSLVFISCSDSVQPGWTYTNGTFLAPVEPSLQEKKDAIWLAIRNERDHRVQTNGFKVEVSTGVFKWFHSDVFSRTQQLGLVMAGAAVPAVSWKTMDGSFVTMTQSIASKIYASAAATDPAIFAAAEQHKAAAWALEDPTAYTAYLDDANWPERYK